MFERMKWFNRPQHHVEGAALRLTTSGDTDFWQRTHYGFRRDNGHFLSVPVSDDFVMTVKVAFEYVSQYDQCGLMVRHDAENWLKLSIEYEDADHSRLGSVVTRAGYSDWATTDIASDRQPIWYRISSEHQLQDFKLDYSRDGVHWQQMRIAHLDPASATLDIGIYACSPVGAGFDCLFSEFSVQTRTGGAS